MSTRKFTDDDDDDEGLFRRHRWLLPLVIILVGSGLGYAATQMKSAPAPPARPPDRMVIVSLPPPPPPPPPKIEPPKVEPPKEEKKEEMVPQEEVKQDEPKPAEPKPADEPPPLGTNNTGPGSDNFGLAGYKPGDGGGNGLIGGSKGGGGGSKFGWYAASVQKTVAEAMQRNSRIRSATMSVQVRIWADSDGRISRAKLVSSTGDGALDSAITDDVLKNLRLSEPPPAGMPMPINMRLTAKKPN